MRLSQTLACLESARAAIVLSRSAMAAGNRADALRWVARAEASVHFAYAELAYLRSGGLWLYTFAAR